MAPTPMPIPCCLAYFCMQNTLCFSEHPQKCKCLVKDTFCFVNTIAFSVEKYTVCMYLLKRIQCR